jgi:hypothetical protein
MADSFQCLLCCCHHQPPKIQSLHVSPPANVRTWALKLRLKEVRKAVETWTDSLLTRWGLCSGADSGLLYFLQHILACTVHNGSVLVALITCRKYSAMAVRTDSALTESRKNIRCTLAQWKKHKLRIFLKYQGQRPTALSKKIGDFPCFTHAAAWNICKRSWHEGYSRFPKGLRAPERWEGR